MVAAATLLMPERRGIPHAAARFEIKSVTADGTFEGYASLFNREDLGRDIIQPGAFRESLLKRGAAKIKMLFQHNASEPIGVWDEIREDARGLYVKGRLMLAVAKAREVLALMRAGALDGLSIGFKAEKARRDGRSGVRRIEKIDLWEISVVTFPMLPEARVFVGASESRFAPSDSRSSSRPEGGGVLTTREWERWLTREAKLSRREARAVMQKRSRDDRPQSVLAKRLRNAAAVMRREAAVLRYDRPDVAELKSSWLKVRGELAYVRLLAAGQRFADAVEEKGNPYHDEAGRFTNAEGAVQPGSGAGQSASGGALTQPARGTNRRGEITSRGSNRVNTLNEVWDNAKTGPKGGKLCPSCGTELMVSPKGGRPLDWQLSHNPSWSNRTFPAGTTRPDVLNNYQTGTQLECRPCNEAGGNNDGRFRRPPLVEGDGGRREPAGGIGGGGNTGNRLRPKE